MTWSRARGAGILLALACSWACHSQEPSPEVRRGKWKKAAPESAAQVAAIPYARGYVAPPPGSSGVTLHDRARAFQGLNLLCSGHAAEGVLFDMDGREIHRWALPLASAFPELAKDANAAKVDYWRRLRMTDDGGLFAIYEGMGIVALDRASRRVWGVRGNFHHDLDVAPDGSIWVLDRDGKILPRINPTQGVLEDFVTRLSPRGEVLERISILEAFERSPFAHLLSDMPRQGDILHTNTLERLDGSLASTLPAFRAGNLLISVLQTSTLAVIDPSTRKVVWALRGAWRKQHQPTVLGNGHLLLFDNTGIDRDHSRALEIVPRDGAVTWKYGGTPEEPLFSRTLGSVQRLPNGDTLITESERGRALEVTPDKRVVWEYRSPYRTGDHDELVAALLEVVRLPGAAAIH
jgi:hypothetical protein